jgi:AraC-like DNA-binding protein
LRGHHARAAADVVCAAVTHQISRNPPAGVPRQALLDRVKAAIEERLGDPDLTPQAIADRHHISVRYLHVLFQQQGTTVNGWVREHRLEAAGRDLARPDAHRRSVAGVAARWGFSNSSHFSRAFREVYGMSPMQWRKRRSTSTSTVE